MSGTPVRRTMLVAAAACAVLVVAGCGSNIEGTPKAAAGTSSSGAASGGGASGASAPTGCDALTEALGPLVSDRPDVSEQKLAGFDEPMCMWSRGPSNFSGALTMIVKVEPHDRAVIEQMRTMESAVQDPRADALDAVVLDVVGRALLTPTHNIIANCTDPEMDEAKKLDMVFAVAEYLAE